MSRWFLGALALLGCGRPAPARSGVSALDDAGITITLPAPATRVVSLVPAATEILFALGAGPAVVGRTKWCDHPPEALAVPSVGDGMVPNVEVVAARKPDLVVIYRSAGNAAATAKLHQLGIPVATVALDRQTDFERDTRLLATLVGRAHAADSLIAKTRADLEQATVHRAKPPSVFVLAWADPPYTIGGGSFLTEIIERAGGVNIFGDSDRPSFVVSIEAVVAKNPDFIVIAGADEPAFGSRPEWQVVPAVRNRRFIRVVDASMFGRPSPRIGEAVATLARAFDAAGK